MFISTAVIKKKIETNKKKSNKNTAILVKT